MAAVTQHLTVWFCTLDRADVQIGARPEVCSYCGSGDDLVPVAIPYVPEQEPT